MTRVVFMGTPAFAVPILDMLVQADYDLAAVVTRPDRQAGRGQRIVASPVKEYATARGLPLLQPKTLRDAAVVQALHDLNPEVIVVAAFGLILPPPVLALPPRGCINVHASLLPKYRGAAPIAAAVLAGELETGITLMLMDEGLDTGPVLAQARLPIAPDDTAGSLAEKLSRLGARLLSETLPRWLAGQVTPQPQDHSQATLVRTFKKEHGRIDWTLPAIEIERRVRAFSPWPSAYTYWKGRLLKVLRAETVDLALPEPPGQVVAQDGVLVATGRGALALREVQLEGKRAMGIDEFVRGQRAFVGAVLGKSAVSNQ